MRSRTAVSSWRHRDNGGARVRSVRARPPCPGPSVRSSPSARSSASSCAAASSNEAAISSTRSAVFPRERAGEPVHSRNSCAWPFQMATDGICIGPAGATNTDCLATPPAFSPASSSQMPSQRKNVTYRLNINSARHNTTSMGSNCPEGCSVGARVATPRSAVHPAGH